MSKPEISAVILRHAFFVPHQNSDDGSTNHELIPVYCVYFCTIKYNYILDLKIALLLFWHSRLRL